MECTLRWFDTLDDLALMARAWWIRGDLAVRAALLGAICLAMTFVAY